jgi:hypothetical protein
MLKRILSVVLSLSCAGTTAMAHHSYGAYIREQKVPIQGVLERLTVGNPHAILEVRSDDGTLFTAEWSSAVQLTRSGFEAGMLAAGDRVIVTGSPSRDPEAHRMALVSEIRRPSDGWRWSRNGVETPH